MTKEEIRILYTDAMTEAYSKVNHVRLKLEKDIDLSGGCEAEEACEIYEAVVSCGIDIINSLSLITGDPFDEIAERLATI